MSRRLCCGFLFLLLAVAPAAAQTFPTSSYFHNEFVQPAVPTRVPGPEGLRDYLADGQLRLSLVRRHSPGVAEQHRRAHQRALGRERQVGGAACLQPVRPSCDIEFHNLAAPLRPAPLNWRALQHSAISASNHSSDTPRRFRPARITRSRSERASYPRTAPTILLIHQFLPCSIWASPSRCSAVADFFPIARPSSLRGATWSSPVPALKRP